MTEITTANPYRTENGRYDVDAEVADVYVTALLNAGLEIGLTPEQVSALGLAYIKHVSALAKEALSKPTGEDGLPV